MGFPQTGISGRNLKGWTEEVVIASEEFIESRN
jgi:hypothetical protein